MSLLFTFLCCWVLGQPNSNPPPVVLGNHRISQLEGMKVEDFDGESLGTLKDFVVDVQAGEIRYAVVSVSGFSGRLSRPKIVPSQLISTATTKKKTLALEVPKFRWKRAPSFRKSDLPDMANADGAQRVNQFYALTPGEPKMTGKNLSRSNPKLTPTDRNTGRRVYQTPSGTRFELASEVIGREVITAQHRSLGRISDFLVDLTGERPTVAIVTAKGVLKEAGAYALPLHRLIPSSPNQFSLATNLVQLEQAPPFTQMAWEFAGDGEQIYRYEMK